MSLFEPQRMEKKGCWQAAVALVLRERGQRAELLLIERSTRADDPWSGHMALPGGRVDAVDRGDREAAERETLEEVGLDLEGAEYMGPLGDLQGARRFRQDALVVSGHVYYLASPEPLRLQPSEVREAFWFPVSDLLEPDRHVPYYSPLMKDFEFPGILVGQPDRHVVWGLTYRFLDIFLGAIARPLPNRWGDMLERLGH